VTDAELEEPPYAGTPLDGGWPGYHTHWTPILIPESPCTPTVPS
jgi:hypothetical protein